MATRQQRQVGDGGAAQREERARTQEARPFADLPAGYEDAGLDAISVDWRETPEVSGKVVGFDTLNTDNGERRVMLLASGGASLMVWETAALRRLFDGAHVGDEVYVHATGTVELPGTRGADGKPKKMRTFKAAIKRALPAERPAPAKPKGGGDDIPF